MKLAEAMNTYNLALFEIKRKGYEISLELTSNSSTDYNSLDKNEVIEKLGWVTQMKSIPPLTKEYIERQYRFCENYVHFLQDNGFTTREILKPGEKATDDSEIRVGDLTEEGLDFYFFGVRKWREKYDRAKDKDKAINDFAYIEKKLREFRAKNQ